MLELGSFPLAPSTRHSHMTHSGEKQSNTNEYITGDENDQSCCSGCITRLWKVFHKIFHKKARFKAEQLPTCLQLQARWCFPTPSMLLPSSEAEFL